MSEAIKGPGILWVQSRIAQSAKAILDQKTFLKWYDDEHIAEVTATSGIRNGFRYIDIDKTSPCGDASNPKPFLAFYPMPELAFTQGDEFRKIGFQSDKLPGTGIIYDLADLDVSYLGFLGATETSGKKGGSEYVLTSGIRPEREPGSEQIDEFYNQQTAQVSQAAGYIRTIRFQLRYARTNAQSRKLKGLPTTDEPHPEPPTWLAIHEFSNVPEKSIVEALRRDPAEVMAGRGWGKTENEVHAWKLDRVHGEGKFFE